MSTLLDKEKRRQVNTYIENRMFFMSKRSSLTIVQLHSFRTRIKHLLKKCKNPQESADLDDLIMDIDIEMGIPRKPINEPNGRIDMRSSEKKCELTLLVNNFNESNLLYKVEREVIRLCLIHFSGNHNAVSRALGCSYVTVRSKIKKYNLDSEADE